MLISFRQLPFSFLQHTTDHPHCLNMSNVASSSKLALTRMLYDQLNFVLDIKIYVILIVPLTCDRERYRGHNLKSLTTEAK
jgi:hypothetical protein